MPRQFYVYIMTNQANTTLHAGVTNNLARRVGEHRHGQGSAFTRKYRTHKLVYYESFDDARSAIAREKQIKGGSRQKKLDLIAEANATWRDLADDL
ncbi:MAG: GIY-YIG nuclease family protein [Chloroflexi bacterium]|nr:GIY-YIG nuclease family protein [Chloroflexota bacterium]